MTRKRLKIQAQVFREGRARVFEVDGQEARSLLALVEAGTSGITAQEVSSWALRLAAYCHSLRHHHGLDIRTDREEHEGGWHGRYVLLTPVKIL